MFCSLLTGCLTDFNAIKHDPQKALKDANPVLKTFYIDENFEAAYQKFDPKLKEYHKADTFGKMLADMKNKYGRVKELQPDSYQKTPALKTIILYYIGKNEKATTYHRIVLEGDPESKSGYQIIGLFYDNKPYPPNKLRFNINKKM